MAATNRNRFPSSHLPEGWFPMGWSHELAEGELKTLHYFDRELVMWRGDSGEVAVQDAFCQHPGAHRGVGRQVKGNDLTCRGTAGSGRRPHFAAEEAKAYSAMRRWAAQFYPPEDQEKMLTAAGSDG
jgi:Rieske [2Fe-2S] domain